MLPPAALTARTAACDSLLLFSMASFSLLALVLLLPLGATPVRILPLSFGVKFTKSAKPPPLPELPLPLLLPLELFDMLEPLL